MNTILQSYGSDMDVYASGTAQVPGWVWGLYAVFGIVYLVSY